MSLIDRELGEVLNPAVKRKSNKTKKLRISAKRIVNGSPEVMVKITGFGKGVDHVKAHLDYITRNGKIEIENDRGEIFDNKEEVKNLYKDWEQDFCVEKRHKNQRDTMHLVLSMPEGTDPESVKNATRDFAGSTFGRNHEYVFALHTDELHPHCHLTVKCLGFDGTRLNPRKDDLQDWREKFADSLRDQGIDAEATPRRARGIVKKAESNVIRHIERGDKTHKPRISKVRALKVQDIVNELASETKDSPALQKPWDTAIKLRQEKIRKAWLSVAAALEQEETNKFFKNKGVHNERPNYNGVNLDRAREGQRAAAVYQSNIAKSRPGASTRTIASLRNLSCIGMVHDEPASQMLLRENAPHRLGWERTANSEMRRTRISDPRPFRIKGVMTYQATIGENKALAEKIRSFVGSMPSIDTERQQIKRDLIVKFSKPLDHARNIGNEATPPQNISQKNNLEQTITKNKDFER